MVSKTSITYVKDKFHQYFDLCFTAHHEAAHVVYGLLHFIKIEYVSVFDSASSKRIEGLTQYNSPDLEQFHDLDIVNERLQVEVGLSYAGVIAERYLFKQCTGEDQFPMFLREGSADDISSASNLIKKYNIVPSGSKRAIYKRKIQKIVAQEIEQYWEAIMIVAHTLFKNKCASSWEIKQLLTTKSKNKKFWKAHYKKFDLIYDDFGRLDEIALKTILKL